MADRGRDLEITLTANQSQFDLTESAAELDELGRASREAGTELETLDRSVRDVDLDRLGTDAKASAGRVDDAFDTIGRSARTNSRTVDTETDDMRRSMRDVGTDAKSAASDVASAFSSSGDIGDGMADLASMAPIYFGPIGAALGAAGALGVRLFREHAEKLKEDVDDLVDAFIEGGGKIQDSFVELKLGELAKEGDLARIEKLVDTYRIAGVTYRDVARAKAGDAAASARVMAALDRETGRRKANTDELGKSEAAVAAVASELDDSREAMRLAQEAAGNYASATESATDRAKRSVGVAGGAWDDLRGNMARGISADVRVNAPSAAQLAAIRAGIVRGIGPVSVNATVTRTTIIRNLFYPGRYTP